uniref:Uncharacterized protein n=1 Tax=Ditylenchus dipsaci TaxID=166011 RepID=A0A915CPQ9_9BILA
MFGATAIIFSVALPSYGFFLRQSLANVTALTSAIIPLCAIFSHPVLRKYTLKKYRLFWLIYTKIFRIGPSSESRWYDIGPDLALAKNFQKRTKRILTKLKEQKYWKKCSLKEDEVQTIIKSELEILDFNMSGYPKSDDEANDLLKDIREFRKACVIGPSSESRWYDIGPDLALAKNFQKTTKKISDEIERAEILKEMYFKVIALYTSTLDDRDEKTKGNLIQLRRTNLMKDIKSFLKEAINKTKSDDEANDLLKDIREFRKSMFAMINFEDKNSWKTLAVYATTLSDVSFSKNNSFSQKKTELMGNLDDVYGECVEDVKSDSDQNEETLFATLKTKLIQLIMDGFKEEIENEAISIKKFVTCTKLFYRDDL